MLRTARWKEEAAWFEYTHGHQKVLVSSDEVAIALKKKYMFLLFLQPH